MQTTLNSKFNIGDNVYGLRNRKIVHGRISTVMMKSYRYDNKSGVDMIEYRVVTHENADTRSICSFLEDELFRTVDEVIAELTKELKANE